VLLGEPPRSAEFARQFDWNDAVVQLPFDSPDVGEFLTRLDANPERLDRIQRTNAEQAALRHDWLYRLEAVFAAVELPPTDEMQARRKRLSELARLAVEDEAEPRAKRSIPALGS
jgi:hypothetical protein